MMVKLYYINIPSVDVLVFGIPVALSFSIMCRGKVYKLHLQFRYIHIYGIVYAHTSFIAVWKFEKNNFHCPFCQTILSPTLRYPVYVYLFGLTRCFYSVVINFTYEYIEGPFYLCTPQNLNFHIEIFHAAVGTSSTEVEPIHPPPLLVQLFSDARKIFHFTLITKDHC